MKKPLAVVLGLMILAAFFLVAQPQVSESATPLAWPTATPAPPPPGKGTAGTGPQLLCPNCPDLIVQSISTDPPMPTVGMTATVKVVIANIGAANVPNGNNFNVDLYVRPPEPPMPFSPGVEAPPWLPWLCQSWYVPVGGTFELTAPYVFTDTNTYALYVQIDTGNNVVETSELNNVLGPVGITVRSSGVFSQSTHKDFQYGYASGLDLSNPTGVVTLGEFWEPWQDVGAGATSVYTPDVLINDVTASYSGGNLLPTTVEQVRPSITAGPGDAVYAVWQDARYGGTYNNRIFFARSADKGATWSANVLLTADIAYTQTVNQLAPRIAYEPTSGQISVVWQDNRRGHYDIYFSASTDGGVTWTSSVRVNNDEVNPGAHKMRPSMVTGGGGLIYVVWQDQRNGNDDIYFTRSVDGGTTWWSVNTYVTDDPETTGQFHSSPSVGLGCSGDCGDWGYRDWPVVYVGWEDWRDPVHPDVYVAKSRDNGATFGVDVPVQYPGGQSYRIGPTLVVITATSQFTKEVDGVKTVVSATVDTVHVAWQEGVENGADVQYSYAWFSYDHLALANEPTPHWAFDFFFRPKIRLNGYHLNYSYAQPPDPKEIWPEEPTWQGEVSMSPANAYVGCSADDITYHEGVYVAWSDGRSFDRDRRDTYVARIAHPHWPNEEITRNVLVCNNNAVVNDNAKLYAYRDNPSSWAITKPANVVQSHPSVFARSVDPWQDDIYVAWDDNRFDTPLAPGTRRNRDVFFTRSEAAVYGVYISPVFDTWSPLTTWYALDWFGTTGRGTPIYFQTRTGQTPNPPKANAATGTWSLWAGTQPANLYDAPGQTIVSPPGRYIQYKLIIDGSTGNPDRFSTAVTRVTIRYQNQLVPVAFLPLVADTLTDPGLGR